MLSIEDLAVAIDKAELATISWKVTAEACQILGCTPPTLRDWARKRKISFYKTPHGRYRWDVQSFLNERVIPAVQSADKKHQIPDTKREKAD